MLGNEVGCIVGLNENVHFLGCLSTLTLHFEESSDSHGTRQSTLHLRPLVGFELVEFNHNILTRWCCTQTLNRKSSFGEMVNFAEVLQYAGSTYLLQVNRQIGNWLTECG